MILWCFFKLGVAGRCDVFVFGVPVVMMEVMLLY